MQTFMPYQSFTETAKCLDWRRLGKQRVEARQILECNLGTGSIRWKNHPAVLMWQGYDEALAYYGKIICIEWIYRGYNDSQLSFFVDFLRNRSIVPEFPYWIDNKAFHQSHRSNLLRKDRDHYSQFNWEVSDDLSYIWPESRHANR